jgi:MFS family permease
MLRRLIGAFNPGLPRTVWVLQLGVLVNFFGNGLVGPFLVIYLHFGRGIPIGYAGSAVALGGVTAVTSGLLAGSLADRLGPRNILAGAMCCNAAAYLFYTQVSAPWQAYAVGLLVGVGTGAYGPCSQSLIAALVPAENRQAAFAQNRVTSVLGLGAGGMTGGFIAAGGLAGYVALLDLDAITFLTFACVVLVLPNLQVASRSPQRGSYAAVLQDRAFLRLVAVNMVMVAFGIAPMFVLLPAFAKVQAHVAETAIGVIYAANTLTIVAAQLPLTRLTSARNRMHVLRASSLIWVASWLACLGAGALLTGVPAAAVIGVAAVAYAAGECLYSAIMLPTTTALAPDHLRSRYLGATGLAWQAGFLIGPSLGGLVLGAMPLALPLLCAAGCLAAAAGTVAVDRSLSPDLRRVTVAARAA